MVKQEAPAVTEEDVEAPVTKPGVDVLPRAAVPKDTTRLVLRIQRKRARPLDSDTSSGEAEEEGEETDDEVSDLPSILPVSCGILEC